MPVAHSSAGGWQRQLAPRRSVGTCRDDCNRANDRRTVDRRCRESPRVFRKAKTVVGLDIGSSAVKAVELQARGQVLPRGGVRHRAGAARRHRRRRHHRRRRGGRRDPPHLRGEQELQGEGRLRVALRQRRDRQEDHAAGDDRIGARASRSTGKRSSTSRSTSRTSTSTTRSSTPAPGRSRAAAWTCCSSRPRKKRSATTPA